MNKYELTQKTRTFGEQTLYRIRALRDFNDVRAGDLGGWVAGPDNAGMYGNASMSGNTSMSGNALVECPQHVLRIGPIGSRGDHLTFYRTADGDGEVRTGCFTGNIASFEAAVKETHAGTAFESEYLALVQLMRIREQSWLRSSK